MAFIPFTILEPTTAAVLSSAGAPIIDLVQKDLPATVIATGLGSTESIFVRSLIFVRADRFSNLPVENLTATQTVRIITRPLRYIFSKDATTGAVGCFMFTNQGA